MRNAVTLPGTGFTTEPGVAALRRTPGQETEIAPNPNGVPHFRWLNEKWNCCCGTPLGFAGFCAIFPGVRRWHGDPRLCCETPLGLWVYGKMWVRTRAGQPRPPDPSVPELQSTGTSCISCTSGLPTMHSRADFMPKTNAIAAFHVLEYPASAR